MKTIKVLSAIGLLIFYFLAGIFIIKTIFGNWDSCNFVYLIDWLFLFPLLLFLIGTFCKSLADFIKEEEWIVRFSELDILAAGTVGGVGIIKGLLSLLDYYRPERLIHWLGGAALWFLILAVYLFLFFWDSSNRIVSDRE